MNRPDLRRGPVALALAALAQQALAGPIPEVVTRSPADHGPMNAAGPVAILVLFLNRFLVQGRMAGAGKQSKGRSCQP